MQQGRSYDSRPTGGYNARRGNSQVRNRPDSRGRDDNRRSNSAARSRSRDRDYDRPRERAQERFIKVNDVFAGKFIGRSGDGISRLELKYRVRISMDRDNSVIRVFSTADHDESAVLDAAASDIQRQYSAHQDRIRSALLKYVRPFIARIAVGKNGQDVKDLERTTGATIDISRERVTGDKLVQIFISGSPEQKEAACRAIEKIEEEDRVRAVQEVEVQLKEELQNGEGEQVTCVVECPQMFLSWFIGPKGKNIREVSEQTGARFKVNHADEDRIDSLHRSCKRVFITGPPDAVAQAKEISLDKVASWTQQDNDAKRTKEAKERKEEERHGIAHLDVDDEAEKMLEPEDVAGLFRQSLYDSVEELKRFRPADEVALEKVDNLRRYLEQLFAKLGGRCRVRVVGEYMYGAGSPRTDKEPVEFVMTHAAVARTPARDETLELLGRVRAILTEDRFKGIFLAKKNGVFCVMKRDADNNAARLIDKICFTLRVVSERNDEAEVAAVLQAYSEACPALRALCIVANHLFANLPSPTLPLAVRKRLTPHAVAVLVAAYLRRAGMVRWVDPTPLASGRVPLPSCVKVWAPFTEIEVVAMTAHARNFFSHYARNVDYFREVISIAKEKNTVAPRCSRPVLKDELYDHLIVEHPLRNIVNMTPFSKPELTQFLEVCGTAAEAIGLMETEATRTPLAVSVCDSRAQLRKSRDQAREAWKHRQVKEQAERTARKKRDNKKQKDNKIAAEKASAAAAAAEKAEAAEKAAEEAARKADEANPKGNQEGDDSSSEDIE
eukprot:Rhum_TRINITY_DN16706_c0_g1::Rhum_TRINITY_DN16706_c0_g1_i1::g.164145::m.164145